jgi:hypothetical protein
LAHHRCGSKSQSDEGWDAFGAVSPASPGPYRLEGRALLLMNDGQTDGLRAGHVVRTPAGAIHGVTNTSSEPFVYLAVTTPPQDFAPAYKGRQSSN